MTATIYTVHFSSQINALHWNRSSDPSDLVVPRARLRFGERAFSVAAPRLWNSLPVDIRNAATLHTFKKKLKTFMFYTHFRIDINCILSMVYLLLTVAAVGF